MRINLRTSPRTITIPVAAGFALLLWVVAAGISAWLVSRGEHDPARLPLSCLFRRLTGVPCATCGGTRMAAAAMRGDVAGAFLFNPLLCVGLLALAGWLVLRVGFARRVEIVATRRTRIVGWAALAVLFLANWAYVIAREL